MKAIEKLPSVYLLNETSRVHAGSRAVVEATIDALSPLKILHFHKVGTQHLNRRRFESADIVVANGEGTIHHRSEGGRFLLETLRLAQKEGKKTLLLNALFQEELPYFDDVFAKLDYLSVREPRSYELAKLNGGTPQLFIDSSVSVRDRPAKARKVLPQRIKGKVHWQCAHKGILDKLDYPQRVVPKYHFLWNFQDFIASLKSCRLYVTGEHHGMFAAGLAGIPFIPIASNSFKIESVLEWAKVDIPVCRTRGDIEESLSSLESRMGEFSKFHDFVQSSRYLKYEDIKDVLLS